jgi:hypothetical protein
LRGVLEGTAARLAAERLQSPDELEPLVAASREMDDVVHDPSLHSERLVAEGPYRHVRNPLYVGLMLLDVGMLPLASALGAAWMLLAMSIFTLRLVGREEAALLAEQGEAFRRYLEAVPLRALAATALPAAGGRPQWGRALLGELLIWAMVAGTSPSRSPVSAPGFTCLGGCTVYPLLQRWPRRKLRGARLHCSKAALATRARGPRGGRRPLRARAVLSRPRSACGRHRATAGSCPRRGAGRAPGPPRARAAARRRLLACAGGPTRRPSGERRPRQPALGSGGGTLVDATAPIWSVSPRWKARTGLREGPARAPAAWLTPDSLPTRGLLVDHDSRPATTPRGAD